MKRTQTGNKRGRRVLLLVALVAVAVSVGVAQASPVTLSEKTLAELFLLASDTPVTPPGAILSIMSATGFSSDVRSAAYLNDEGNYVYLYQVHNSALSIHPVELFTLFPFATEASPDMGYLSGTGPAFFLTGTGQVPDSLAETDTDTDVVSFYFDRCSGHQIIPGATSRILYIVSPLAPVEITGNVIDGTIASGTVVGVPEPATLALLAMGAGAVALRRRRR